MELLWDISCVRALGSATEKDSERLEEICNHNQSHLPSTLPWNTHRHPFVFKSSMGFLSKLPPYLSWYSRLSETLSISAALRQKRASAVRKSDEQRVKEDGLSF